MAQDPIQPQPGQSPGPITDPQKLFMLAQLLGGGQPQGAPPAGLSDGAPASAPPTQPAGGVLPPTSPFDLSKMVSQVSSLPQYQKATGSLDQIQQQEQALQQRMANMPLPKQGWSDTQGQPQKPGFLHSLGRAMTALGGATNVGQAIQGQVYGPGIRKYGEEKASLAQQLADLKGQESVPTEELRSLSSLTGAASTGVYRGGELDVRNKLADIQQQKTTAYTQSVQNRLATAMRGLDLRAIATGSQVELNKARITLDNALAQVAPERIETERYGIDTNNATRMAVANVMSQLGIDKTHPIAGLLDSIMGTGMTPSAPQTQSGAQPVAGATPLPAKKPATKAPEKSVGDTVNF